VSHIFEEASTGRSKCRGCSQLIAKGELRFGERLPNPFAEGEMTHWFHPSCAAYKRPEALLQGLAAADVPGREALESAARRSLEQPRLPRIDGAERAPSSQARCRHCHEPIEKGSWRIRLVFHEEGTFNPSGFIHLACREPYFETADILDPVLYFSRALSADEREELRRAFATA
jgi:poly(ADP-ribose) polymerase-like protein